MKIVPLEQEIQKYNDLRQLIVHTGQHYDTQMSDIFFDQLGLSRPDHQLDVRSGGHGEMTGRIMIEFEKVCLEIRPDMVVVVGDVNSTMAAALVARKLLIPVAHVEAGLRSFDESMPEEINRRVADCLSNLLFVSEPSGMVNLAREGVDSDRVYLVGDIMLETLQAFLPVIQGRKRWDELGLDPFSYALVTLHRPSNVDSPEALGTLVEILSSLAYPVIFPVHPRTTKRIDEFGLRSVVDAASNLRMLPPESYVDFLSLMGSAAVVLSDSGSVQGEASFFNVPCLVCRENTERPFYIEHGTSELVGRDKDRINQLVRTILEGQYRKSDSMVQELGTGVAAKTVKHIANYMRSTAAQP